MDSQNLPQSSESSGSGKMTAAIIIVIIAIVGLVAWFAANKTSDNPPANNGVAQGELKTFDLSAKPFEYSIKEIRVKKGDRVKINLTVELGMHDWVVDEFAAKTTQVTTGQSTSVEFVADKTGTFEYYCSVPTHRLKGMVGKLIVE